MRPLLILWPVACLLPGLVASADDATPSPAPAVKDVAAPAPELAGLKAYQAVHEGNRRLRNGAPAAALEAYDHAESQRPDAREIAFVQGLAHYDLKQFDEAREAFRKAEGLADDPLANDALYSLGASDHAQALESLDDPQLALSLLEDGMRRYHEVLTRQPDHQAARDANFKAASMWRELKQQMQQQQQQSSDQSDEQQDQEKQEQDKQQSQQEDQQQQDEEKQSQEEQQKQEQEQAQDQEPSEQQEQQQVSEAEKQQQVSREQAQRKLRELMQAQRERKKQRREPAERIPVRPVDKDW